MRTTRKSLFVLMALVISLTFVEVPSGAVASGFSDVPATAWYAEDVEEVRRFGIINGVGNNCFAPNKTLTMAEALTMACRAYSFYYNVPIPASKPGEPWYETYHRFAQDQGILWRDEIRKDVSGPCTRLDMALVFYRVFPTETVKQLNQIAFLPDIERDENSRGVFFLYEQGVLTGSDAIGTFRPYAGVTRAETAAILNRVMNPGRRLSFTFRYEPLPAAVYGSSKEEAAMADRLYKSLLRYLKEENVHNVPVRDPTLDKAAHLVHRGGARSAAHALKGIGYPYPVDDVQINSYTTRTFCIQTGQTEVFTDPYTAIAQLCIIPHSVFDLPLEWEENDRNVFYDRVGVSAQKVNGGYQATFVVASSKGRDVIDGEALILKKVGAPLKISADGLYGYGQHTDVVERASVHVSQIPTPLLLAYQHADFQFIIADGEHYAALCSSDRATNSAGLTAYGRNNRVQIHIYALDHPHTVYHEFGHVLHDLWLDAATLDKLFAAELSQVMSLTGDKYASGSARECFAEAFRLYLQDKDGLARTAPGYYQAIETALQKHPAA